MNTINRLKIAGAVTTAIVSMLAIDFVARRYIGRSVLDNNCSAPG